ncbi:MAG: class I SAM-dependent methyltransferase [Gemmatimonadales bacterium]
MGETPPDGFDPVIRDYYDRAPEETRLQQGPFELEEARTRELIQRFAPPPPGIIVDVGGAAGAYALWLAEAGYSVHLVDPVPRLVAEAQRRRPAATQPLASCRVGDARALELPGDTADAVLLRWASALDGLARDLLQDPGSRGSWSKICGTGSTATRPTGWIISRQPTFTTPRSWRTR